MNEVIRRGVFETNSSSSHSITIAGVGDMTDRLPVVDGVCEVYPGEFGWEIADHYDAATKAGYCLTYVKGLREGGEYETHGKDDADRLEAMLADVIRSHTGATEVRFVPAFTEETKTAWSFYEWGYIDHQSHEVCAEAFADDATLAQFIFNPASLLHTDNDNH